MIVPIRTNVIREVVSMHVYLQNVARLHIVRHKRMMAYVIVLRVILEMLRQHATQVRYLFSLVFPLENHIYTNFSVFSCTFYSCTHNSWM